MVMFIFPKGHPLPEKNRLVMSIFLGGSLSKSIAIPKKLPNFGWTLSTIHVVTV